MSECKHNFEDGVCQYCDATKDGPCDHYFITGKKKEHASALGTHHAHCEKCNMNLFSYVCRMTAKKYKDEMARGVQPSDDEPDIHICVWDADDRTKCVSVRGQCPHQAAA